MRNNDLHACPHVSAAHSSLNPFFSFSLSISLSLFLDERILYLFSPPKPAEANVQHIMGKGYFYKPGACCERHLRGSSRLFSAYFLFDSFKGPFKIARRVDSYFYHSTCIAF